MGKRCRRRNCSGAQPRAGRRLAVGSIQPCHNPRCRRSRRQLGGAFPGLRQNGHRFRSRRPPKSLRRSLCPECPDPPPRTWVGIRRRARNRRVQGERSRSCPRRGIRPAKRPGMARNQTSTLPGNRAASEPKRRLCLVSVRFAVFGASCAFGVILPGWCLVMCSTRCI